MDSAQAPRIRYREPTTTSNCPFFLHHKLTYAGKDSAIMQALKFFLAILSAAVQLQAQHTLLPSSGMHPIELANLNRHLEVFTPPGEYLIYLKPGHTISQHLKAIGKDLSPHFRRYWEDFEIFERAHYII